MIVYKAKLVLIQYIVILLNLYKQKKNMYIQYVYYLINVKKTQKNIKIQIINKQMQSSKSNNFDYYKAILAGNKPQQQILGSLGNVHLSQCLKTKKLVLLKKLSYKLSNTEIDNITKLPHNNILKIIQSIYDYKYQVCYLVMEYFQGLTLFYFIKFNHNKYKNRQKNTIKYIFQCVKSAVNYFHDNNLYRLDIKPENILINLQDNLVKFCYFGISLSRTPRMSICRTLQYLAPEILLKLTYTKKVDIWSLGRTPFQGHKEQQLLNAFKNMHVFSDNFSKLEIKIITSLLKINPKERVELIEICKKQKYNHNNNKNIYTMHNHHNINSMDNIGNMNNIHKNSNIRKQQISKISTIDQTPAINKKTDNFITSNTVNKIKLLQVKDMQNIKQKKPTSGIHITSIRKLTVIQQQFRSPTGQQLSRMDKIKYSASLHNKQKISLKKFDRKYQN